MTFKCPYTLWGHTEYPCRKARAGNSLCTSLWLWTDRHVHV